MKKGFNFVKPTSLSQALEHLYSGDGDTIIISGGTDIMIQLRYNSISPKKLVDVHDLQELKFIEEKGNIISIGGAVTFTQITKDNTIRKTFPSLIEAAKEVGSPQIRNIGTLSGNVQTASPAGDGLIALYALDAKVELVSVEGSREVNIRDFIVGPKKTIKKPNEIIKCFKIEKQHWDYDKFFKVGKRNALAISIVNGIIKINFNEDKTVKEARIVLGAVGPTPIGIERAEKYLIGKRLTEEIIKGTRNIIESAISPISDIRGSSEYRKYIAAIKCGRYIELAKGGICHEC